MIIETVGDAVTLISFADGAFFKKRKPAAAAMIAAIIYLTFNPFLGLDGVQAGGTGGGVLVLPDFVDMRSKQLHTCNQVGMNP